MSFTSSQLQTELNTDPKGLGYPALIASGNDAGLAALLNALIGNGTGNVFKSTVSALDIQAALDPTEFGTLTNLQLAQLSYLVSGGLVNSGSSAIRQIFAKIFPNANFPTTLANLTALASRIGSRAEVLFGVGTTIGTNDIAKALGRG